MRAAVAAVIVLLVVAPAAGARGSVRPAMARAELQPEPQTITVAVSGDLLIHDALWQEAAAYAGGRGYDFRPLFRRIRPLIRRADLAICHVETPLMGGTPSGYPVFRTPLQLARAIRWTGWDACTTASNHSLDQGSAGVDSTLRALDRNGIRHAGSARSAAEAARPVILTTRSGVKVALIAWTMVSNGQTADHPWRVNATDSALPVLRAARRARMAGAQVVIVNFHWGDEFHQTPNALQQRVARTLAISGLVTAVVGQHAHVVQPIRFAGGSLVLYGEGNLVSAQSEGPGMPAATQDGVIGLLRIRVPAEGEGQLERIDYMPTYVQHPGHTIIPVGVDRSRPEFVASLRRTLAVMGRGRHFGPWRSLTP